MLFSEYRVQGDDVLAVLALYGQVGCMVGR